jgi:integrase
MRTPPSLLKSFPALMRTPPSLPRPWSAYSTAKDRGGHGVVRRRGILPSPPGGVHSLPPPQFSSYELKAFEGRFGSPSNAGSEASVLRTPPPPKRQRTASFSPRPPSRTPSIRSPLPESVALRPSPEPRCPRSPSVPRRLSPPPPAFVPRSRVPTYDTHCARCGLAVPLKQPAAVCDEPRCSWLLCLRCFPDTDLPLRCPDHKRLTVRTAGGRSVVLPRPAVAVHLSGSRNPLGRALLGVAEVLLGAAPSAVGASMNVVVSRFHLFLAALGTDWAAMCPADVVSYFVARCTPELDTALPLGFPKAVQPITAAGDLSLLRRYSRVRGDVVALAVLKDDLVSRVSTVACACSRRDKSPKAPVLMADLERFLLRPSAPGRDAADARDGAMLLVGLLFGLRRAELVRLTVADASYGLSVLKLTVRQDKTNQSLLGSHHARSVSSSHRLLDRVWPAYAARFLAAANLPTAPLFPRLDRLGRATSAALAPSSVSAAVKRAIGPQFSAHSLRVGCASELFRAGVPLPLIKEIGRWRSDAALLYVIPSADQMAHAGRKMGAPALGPWRLCPAAAV